jgi:hypothetical protein
MDIVDSETTTGASRFAEIIEFVRLIFTSIIGLQRFDAGFELCLHPSIEILVVVEDL